MIFAVYARTSKDNHDIDIYTHSDNHNVEIEITCNLMVLA